MTQSGLPPRRAALYLVDQVMDGRLMAELLASGALDRLPPDGRARAQRLAVEALRFCGRADACLAGVMDKRPPGTVGNILRIAVVELCQGGAPHGVVNDWVEICARGKRTKGMKGLVNAVLRRVSREADNWAALPNRMPEWLRDPLVDAWGAEAVAGMEAAHEGPVPLDLSAKPGVTVPGDALPTGSFRVVDPGQVTALPGYDAGDWWVQDAAAAVPALVLAAQPGERVLDLCAAPGGKTMQLAATGAEVTAVDDSAGRMERLQANLARTGLAAKVRVDDVRAVTGQWDAVLLDAPCSATGTLRRHPDLPYAKDGGEFNALIELQAELVDHALTLVAPQGRLVYCTCSLLPDEGEVQIEEALARNPGWVVDRAALDQPGIDPGWITPEGGLRLRPDYWAERGGMDGFYVAVLRPSTGR